VGLPDALVDVLVRAIHFEPSLRIGDVMEFFHIVGRAIAPMLDDHGAVTAREGSVGTTALLDDSGPSPVPSGLYLADGSPVDRSVSDRVTAANLWQLVPGQEAPTIAGRKINLVRADDGVDLEVGDKIRLRVAYVRPAEDRIGLHLKGLTCFVSEAGRRPSSAITMEASSTVEFISAGGEILGQVEVAFAAEGPSRTVVSIARESLVVASKLCRNVIALDFGPGLTCVLLYESAEI
jgi:hypothetical protein